MTLIKDSRLCLTVHVFGFITSSTNVPWNQLQVLLLWEHSPQEEEGSLPLRAQAEEPMCSLCSRKQTVSR